MDVKALKELGLFILKDGVYFNSSICPIKEYDKLYEELLRIGIVDASFEKIRELLNGKTTDSVRICDSLEEYNKFKDDYIKVSVSRDRLDAYLDVTFPGTGEEITYNDIMHKILAEGIRYNIDKEKIRTIVDNKIFSEREIIALGTEPMIGVEAQIVLEVDTEVDKEPLMMDDGSVDFRQVNLLRTVEKDQLLAVKIPPSKGTDGTDVFGNPIDSTGKNKTLPIGRNTYISEDGLSLYAATNGRIVLVKGVYHVEEVLNIVGDVDYSTGNIIFNGDVVIGGDVLAGFRVTSVGDIRIKGTVEGAEIISTEGSIYVSRGIVGQDKAKIVAKKDVKAEYINDATIIAGNDVEVRGYIIRSNVTAENEVRAVEGRGMIERGKVYAEKLIDAKVAGSPNSVRTELHVARQVAKEVYEKMLYIEQDIGNLEKRQKSIRKDIEFFELLSKRLKKFPEDKKEELKKQVDNLKKVEEMLKEVRKKKVELEKSYGPSLNEEGKTIRVNTLHRGVFVGIGQNKFLAEYTYKFVLIYSKEGELKINYKTRFAS